MKTNYVWVAMPADSSGDNTQTNAKIGPAGSGDHEPFALVVRTRAEFRLLDVADATSYVGHILGDDAGSKALDDFGRRSGCTIIEYH